MKSPLNHVNLVAEGSDAGAPFLLDSAIGSCFLFARLGREAKVEACVLSCLRRISRVHRGEQGNYLVFVSADHDHIIAGDDAFY